MKIFRVFDFETTGFPPNAGVMEVGWTDLRWEGNSMEVGATISHVTNPGIPCEIGARAVHHISDSEIRDAPHPAKIIEEMLHGADFFAAHNIRFELGFVKIDKPTICTFRCARLLLPEAKGYKNQELRYYLDLDLPLDRCDPPHRAGPDSFVTAHVLRQLLIRSAKQGGAFVDRLVQITNEKQLLTHFTFGKYKGQTFQQVAKSNPGYLEWILQQERGEEDVKYTAKYWLQNTRPGEEVFVGGE